MPELSNPGGGGGYDYVQDAEPTDATEGEEWYDTGANAAYVYDGANWIEQTVVDHTQLSGVSSGQHHTKTTSSEIDHANVSNVNSGQHHTRYSDSEARSAVRTVIASGTYTGHDIGSARLIQAALYNPVETEFILQDDGGAETIIYVLDNAGDYDQVEIKWFSYRDSDATYYLRYTIYEVKP